MNKKQIIAAIAIIVIVAVLIMLGVFLADKFMEMHGKSFLEMHFGR